MEFIEDKIDDDPDLDQDLDEHIIHINDYILLRLFKQIFSFKDQSSREREVSYKII